jgi:dihydrofolate reductase
MLFPSFSAQLEPLDFSAKLTGGHMVRPMIYEEMRIFHESLPLEAKKEDFKRSMGDAILMGRKTYASIGKPLPGREISYTSARRPRLLTSPSSAHSTNSKNPPMAATCS